MFFRTALLATVFMTSIAQAKVEVSYTSNYQYDYTNVFFTNGYTLNYDQNYIDQCKAKVAATPAQPNHRLFGSIANPTLFQVRQDPYGRGRYEDKKMICKAVFINDSTDCVYSNNVYGPGESYTERLLDHDVCAIITTRYTCSSASWGNGVVVGYQQLPWYKCDY